MNSKQRRHGRVFAHSVTLVARGPERYLEFEQRVKQAKMWLQWQTKRKNWTPGRVSYDSAEFRFQNGALAAVFALKWT